MSAGMTVWVKGAAGRMKRWEGLKEVRRGMGEERIQERTDG